MALRAMDHPETVTSVIEITVCKVIQKLLTKIDFLYQIDLFGFFHLDLVSEIHFCYYFSNKLTYCNYTYRSHVVQLIPGFNYNFNFKEFEIFLWKKDAFDLAGIRELKTNLKLTTSKIQY